MLRWRIARIFNTNRNLARTEQGGQTGHIGGTEELQSSSTTKISEVLMVSSSPLPQNELDRLSRGDILPEQ